MLAGERSGLRTHIAATESVSLCVRMKSDGVSGTRIGDSRLRELVDKLARFFQNSASLNGSESGGGLSPLGSSSLPDPQFQNQLSGEKERKNHESIDSTKKSNSTISRRVNLLRAFADGTRTPTATATGRRLSEGNTAEGDLRSSTSQVAASTRPSVLLRSLATQPALQHGHRSQALFNNTTGDDNTASGLQALVCNTTGDNNTATVLRSFNTSGGSNTATGACAP